MGEYLVAFGPPSLLEVVGDAGGDGVARHLLAPLSGKADEWEVAVPLADGGEKVDPVGPIHVVVGDDTVDAAAGQSIQPGVDARGRVDDEAVVFPFEERRRQRREVRIVVDVEDVNRLRHGRH